MGIRFFKLDAATKQNMIDLEMTKQRVEANNHHKEGQTKKKTFPPHQYSQKTRREQFRCFVKGSEKLSKITLQYVGLLILNFTLQVKGHIAFVFFRVAE